MTWKMDQSPAPSRIKNDDCPVTIAPREDGTWGLRLEGGPEILGRFPSAQSAHDYATSRWTCVRPLRVESDVRAIIGPEAEFRRLHEIATATS